MELTDKIWQELEGGYKVPYNVSIPLKQLEQTNDMATVNKILDELWNELHHQGDVGIASYLAVPQLVRIAKEKGLFNWRIIGLCSVIEQQRTLGNNPDLPNEFQEYYNNGLEELKQFVLKNINNNLDKTTYLIAISTIVSCDGRTKLGRAIQEFESEEILNEFLEQF